MTDDWGALDREDFDAVEYINLRFPTEHSLSLLPPYASEVQSRIATLDGELSAAVAAQSHAGLTASRDLAEAQGAIRELSGKIRDIQAKAEQSEVMVQEICRDIRQLDHAKRHLQTTITALKRLHMLVTAVDQLQQKTEERYYKEAANLLGAVRQLLHHFDGYAAIPKIAEIKEMVDIIKARLTTQIHEAFDEIGQLAAGVADVDMDVSGGGSPSGAFSSLKEACLVVDALGAEARKTQVDKFCREQLAPYKKLFGRDTAPDPDAATLEQVERRFAWFKRLLRGIDDRFGAVFPEGWKVTHRLTLQFMAATREQLLALLEDRETSMSSTPDLDEEQQVEVLLRALQKCLAFEREMAARFEEPAQSLSPKNSADAGGATMRRGRKPRRGADGHRVSMSTLGPEPEQEDEEVLLLMKGQLTELFDPFLGPYLQLEKRNLDAVVQRISGEGVESVRGDVATLSVFESSVDVFMYIKGSVKRCTALTTGQAFFNLQKQYKQCLREYAALLDSKVQAIASRSGAGAETVICYVVTTAEYCGDTVPQLEDLVRARIDGAYKESIDLADEQDAFHDASASAVMALVSALEDQVNPAFRSFGGVNWSSFSDVGEESRYVLMVQQAALEFVAPVRRALPPLFFRSFCDKFCGAFLQRYHGLIMRQRRVSNEGLQQLLLDLYSIDKLMQALPILGLDPKEGSDGPPPTVPLAYKRLVNAHVKRIEACLKLAQIPTEILLEEFRRMFPDEAAEDLQAIMSLKGLKRQEQLEILERLGGSGAESARQAAQNYVDPASASPARAAPPAPPPAAAAAPAALAEGEPEAESSAASSQASRFGSSLRMGWSSAMRTVGQKGGLFSDGDK
uniref:Vps53 N-terminal domain-containing protein n=1 Tax=Phaeomonas parva TaxID=124430 RepID=A0A7S1XQR9_9STRA|mmetsp:Transcript_24913/g.77987  ORF Transcript_24913/g.77987 Transcript_24913/m.77987 type:complete len:853 (+) Transcript_24913:109-2667(+)